MENLTSIEKTSTFLDLFNPPLSEDPISLKITISVLMIIIFFIGVVGNVASCIVILKNQSMRTVTNMYLLNLAASDLLLLSTIYFDLHSLWTPNSYPFGYFGCKLHVFSIDLFMTNGIITILAIAIERYFAIFHPLSLKARAKSRVVKVIGIIWILSFIVTMFDNLVIELQINTNVVMCMPLLTVTMRITNGVLAILIFVIPMIVIGVVYAMIAFKLNRKDQSRDVTFNKVSSRRKATRMLGVLTVAFFVCWFPTFLMRVMNFITNYSYSKALFGKILRSIMYLNAITSWLSTAVNPIIFSIMSKQFKNAFKALLRKRDLKRQSKHLHVSERKGNVSHRCLGTTVV